MGIEPAWAHTLALDASTFNDLDAYLPIFTDVWKKDHVSTQSLFF